MERLVLDSSVWVELERQTISIDEAVPEGYHILVPAMVAAELRHRSYLVIDDAQRHQQALQFLDFVESITEFVPFDKEVVDTYVELVFHTRKQGTARSVSDLMIAATAVAHGALLKSLDKRARFEELPNLRVLP